MEEEEEFILPDGVRVALAKFAPHLAHVVVGKDLTAYSNASGPNVVSVNDEIIVKYGAAVTSIEADTLRFVEKETSIPVPQLKGFCEDEEGDGYLVMTRVAGSVLYVVWDSLSTEEKNDLASELAEYFEELHSLTQTYIGAIGRRHPLDDTFKNAQPLGPYETESEMNEAIVRAKRSIWEERGGSPPESYVLTRLPALPTDHKIVFCHGDIDMANIIVDMNSKRVAGIVGWRKAGFYPEHWDFVNALVIRDWFSDFTAYIPRMLKPYYTEYALWFRLRQSSIFGIML